MHILEHLRTSMDIRNLLCLVLTFNFFIEIDHLLDSDQFRRHLNNKNLEAFVRKARIQVRAFVFLHMAADAFDHSLMDLTSNPSLRDRCSRNIRRWSCMKRFHLNSHAFILLRVSTAWFCLWPFNSVVNRSAECNLAMLSLTGDTALRSFFSGSWLCSNDNLCFSWASVTADMTVSNANPSVPNLDLVIPKASFRCRKTSCEIGTNSPVRVAKNVSCCISSTCLDPTNARDHVLEGAGEYRGGEGLMSLCLFIFDQKYDSQLQYGCDPQNLDIYE